MGNKQARDIFYKVIQFYKRTEAEIISPRRLREYAEVRSVIINLLRELTSLSLPEIGRILGGRDHTTVLHHLRLKFDEKRFWSSDSPTWKYFNELKDEIEKEFSKF
jgi:chromosomal replication initiation ATPase DnaA